MKVSTYTERKFLQKYQEKVGAHMYVPFQKIIELLKPISGKKILDIGSGSGELAFELAKKGGQVTGVDISKKWIDYCNAEYKNSQITFVRGDAAKRLPFKFNSFDAVVMNMVLLNVSTWSEVEAIFKEIARVLKPNGVLIFSDLHPLCIMSADVPPTRSQTYSKNFSYFKKGAGYTAKVLLGGGKKMEFHNKHWPLEDYTDVLNKNGLCIYKIAEPTYSKNAPKILQKFKVPEYILFGCKKLK
jgi:ubiquinone/menaquinone biosynthesis C-methylase UbiE